MTRGEIIKMTEEEAREWIFEYPPDSVEFIRRFNMVYFDCGLSRAGITLSEPSCSGELICEL